jgi:hypothetical protein
MVLIRAGRGMTGDPSSALVPDVSVADARRHAPALAVVDLARANHYELLDPPNDEAIAAAVLRLAA